ncbi:hypothetical protein [Spiribacter insolitus]|uniref:Uncharacterized protein n=1 Tax=Spiribacter insolitus TaxID=3122417 RepID=A0ABV3T7W2_9GAMM
MPKPSATNGSVSLFLLGVGLVLFVSPLTIWWLDRTPPWYMPFVAWFGFILLIALSIGRRGRHDL